MNDQNEYVPVEFTITSQVVWKFKVVMYQSQLDEATPDEIKGAGMEQLSSFDFGTIKKIVESESVTVNYDVHPPIGLDELIEEYEPTKSTRNLLENSLHLGE